MMMRRQFITLYILFRPFSSRKVEAKDTKMEDAPKAGEDAAKEIQDKPKDVMETAGDPVKKNNQEDEEGKE